MNKLGFYTQNSQNVHQWINEVQPPVILLHAWDQGLLTEIRQFRSPNTFVIGRMDYIHFDGNKQAITQNLINQWLDGPDPAGAGRVLAEHILNDNFQLAQRRENGRLLIDAWMSLNESIPGPASGAFGRGGAERAEIERRLRAYDRFQVAFRDKLMEQGIEAVAFNFGAGNFTRPDHYLDYFEGTLNSYTFLGFHEYGWPALSTDVDPAAVSSAGTYRPIVKGIRDRTGRDYQVIMTEAGLARMYKHQDGAGDVGWLYPPDSVSQDHYWASLDWFNDYMVQDEFVLGACLFQVGHGAGWDTFRHFGQDNQGQTIDILNRVKALRDKVRPVPVDTGEVEAPVERPERPKPEPVGEPILVPSPGAKPSPVFTPTPVPMPPAIDLPRIYTNQQMIDAFANAAARFNLERWDLLSRAGFNVNDLAQAREAIFNGPPPTQMRGLSTAEQAVVAQELLGELLQRVRWVGLVTAGDGLNVRSGPGAEFARIDGIPHEELVQVLHEEDGWLFVVWQGRMGYVSANWVSRRTPTAPTVAAASTTTDVNTLLRQVWDAHSGLIMDESLRLGIDPAMALAVLMAESNGRTTAADGRPIIRFEAHIFFDQWGFQNPELFGRFFEFDPNERWKGHRWRRHAEDSFQAMHNSQADEWAVLDFARSLHEELALRSTSIGAAQIMGFNHRVVGYNSATEMFKDFQRSADNQIRGFFRFVEGRGLDDTLRRGDVLAFATGYNGSGQAELYRGIILRYLDRVRTQIPETVGVGTRDLGPDVVDRLPQPLGPDQLGGKTLAEVDLALYEAWRAHIEQGFKNNQSMFDRILNGFMSPYWTTVWMYRALFVVGILAFVAAIVLAYVTQDNPTTAIGGAAVFGGVGVLAFLAFFISRPLQALEENLQLITWLGIIYNTYWTRLAYISKLDTVQDEIDAATTKTIDQIKELMDKHGEISGKRGGLR